MDVRAVTDVNASRERCVRGYALRCKKSFVNLAIFLDTEIQQIYTFVSCNFAVVASMFNR